MLIDLCALAVFGFGEFLVSESKDDSLRKAWLFQNLKIKMLHFFDDVNRGGDRSKKSIFGKR